MYCLQDEVFHMSDVSLAGSAFTTESPIQIAVPRGSDTRQQIAATEEDKEFGEATQLISWSNKKDNSRQICKVCKSEIELMYNHLEITCALFMLDLGGWMDKCVD
jgi:hypothetical protein